MSHPTPEDMSALRGAKQEAIDAYWAAWSARHPYVSGVALVCVGALLAVGTGGFLSDRKFGDAALMAFLVFVFIALGCGRLVVNTKARDRWGQPA